MSFTLEILEGVSANEINRQHDDEVPGDLISYEEREESLPSRFNHNCSIMI